MSTRTVMSPLLSVQRSTGVPSGAVPKGSTVVLAEPRSEPRPRSESPSVAPAGAAALPTSSPVLIVATSGQ
ncbi:hypothetical protein GCM10023328_14750 [Modestobacter marinus]|uniref:Uncharacterized protein n=1 Tax=Modestobacter marinus TaxID=477641 RepID=A0ABQ2FWG6_9ACTN|nr:hypothetical protein GCM10011589_16120 [Modestobacter marinus]